MVIRTFAVLLCFLLLFFVFPGCSSEEKGSPPSTEPLSFSWPPDTMVVKLVGGGEVRLTAKWVAHLPGDSAKVVVGSWSVTVGPDTTPSGTHPPPPPGPTPAMQVKAIMDLLPAAKTHDALYFVKAPGGAGAGGPR